MRFLIYLIYKYSNNNLINILDLVDFNFSTMKKLHSNPYFKTNFNDYLINNANMEINLKLFLIL